MTPVLIDSGAIVALFDSRERHHRQCATLVQELERRIVTCEAVIMESCHLLRRLPGAPERVIENIENGIFAIDFSLTESASQIRSILRKYRDVPASLADSCLISLAEQENTGDILTLDSDFQVYRWRGNRPFHNLVSLGS